MVSPRDRPTQVHAPKAVSYGYRTEVGLPAYDAALWAAPLPSVRRIFRLPSGVASLRSDRRDKPRRSPPGGHRRRAGAGEPASVSRRHAALRSLSQPPAGAARRSGRSGADGADTRARWLAPANADRMIQVHLPLGCRAAFEPAIPPTPFCGDYMAAPADLARLIALFAVEIEDETATPLLVETYVSLIVQKIAVGLGRKTESEPSRPRVADVRIKRVLDAIEDRLGENASLAEFARQADLSTAHFVRLFRAMTGLRRTLTFSGRRHRPKSSDAVRRSQRRHGSSRSPSASRRRSISPQPSGGRWA